MPKVTYISSDGEETTIDAKEGDSVMRTAVYNGVEGIVGECGGSLACATCHVYVEDAFLDKVGPAEGDEEMMLDGAAADVKPNSRLSCQIRMTDDLDGLVVRMPDSQH